MFRHMFIENLTEIYQTNIETPTTKFCNIKTDNVYVLLCNYCNNKISKLCIDFIQKREYLHRKRKTLQKLL